MTNQPNNVDILKEVMDGGPLTTEESRRRATVAFYNDLYNLFQEKLALVDSYPGYHRETRQVLAHEGLIILEAAEQYGSFVGVDPYVGDIEEVAVDTNEKDEN